MQENATQYIIKRLLVTDPERRLTTVELATELESGKTLTDSAHAIELREAIIEITALEMMLEDVKKMASKFVTYESVMFGNRAAITSFINSTAPHHLFGLLSAETWRLCRDS